MIFSMLLGLVSIGLLSFQQEAMAAQNPPGAAGQVVVGRLSGDDVSVNGAVTLESKNGRTTAMLASGSDVKLQSGQAKIDLAEGGDVILCGPAHLSIVKSGAALTIALDYGQVHLQVGSKTDITIYTPLWIAKPVSVGDRDRDLTVGIDQKGELCITASSGAMRIEQQLTAESLVVPQGGDIRIEGDDLRALRSGTRACSCELLVSGNGAQKQIESSPPRPPVNRTQNPLASEPTYRIDVPLTFDASSAPPRGLSVEAVQVIRESVANPPPSFRGAVRLASPAPPAELSRVGSRTRNSKLHFFARFFGIFHHHKTSPVEQSAAVR